MTGTPLDEFTANMRRILKANFGNQVPGDTKRSKGLEPQCGLIVGAAPDRGWLQQLAMSLNKLPASWSPYTQRTLHCTFGAREYGGSPDVNDEVRTGYASLTASTRRVLDSSAFDGVALISPHLLVSADTIILACELTPGAFSLRGALLDGQETPAPVKTGWGCHMTLARAKRVLTADERAETDIWIGTAPAFEDILPLTHVVVSTFSVRDDTFQFTSLSHTPLSC